MALTVPSPQVESIKKFLALPDDKVASFLDALAKAGPQFSIADLSLEVSEHIDIPKELTFGIVHVLGSLYLTRDARTASKEDFVDEEVFTALKKASTFTKEHVEVQWAKHRGFLISALNLEDTVGTAAKAGYILTQHERIFVRGGILTDVRPIFHVDTSDKPHAALIVHMLRIVFRDSEGKRFENFFALDANDVRSLKTLIDRALKKEETLKNLMADANVTVLQPKEFY